MEGTEKGNGSCSTSFLSSTVFVTVGTTCFDELVEKVISQNFLETLKNRGYRKLLIQTGSGSVVPKNQMMFGIQVESYDYKPSIGDDITKSSLVISHAGAGSVLEVLRAGKPLIVVINEKLMDNHQLELAEAFYNMNHLYYCTCRKLNSVMQEKDMSKLLLYEEGRPEIFGSYVAEYMGFTNEQVST